MSHEFFGMIPNYVGRALGLQNDLKGLRWIHDFGWLRPLEIGMLCWPEAANPRKNGERIVRKWRKNSLVLKRKLPAGAGSAYVLSAAGAAFLQRYGFSAESGKDWGRAVEGQWAAPASWRHDLMAAGLLAHLHKRGFTIVPENRLRRENPGPGKIPDGLAMVDGKVYWVEVERARKSDERMNDLVQLVIATCEGRARTISGLNATDCVVGFDPTERDEQGHAIDHSLRIRRAVAEQSSLDVSAVFLQLDLHGHNVAGFKREQPSIIESTKVSRVVDVLNFRTVSSSVSLPMEYKEYCVDDYLLQYRELTGSTESTEWEWVMSFYGPVEKDLGKAKMLCRGKATSEARCRRMLAMAYLQRHEYYPYDQGIDGM